MDGGELGAAILEGIIRLLYGVIRLIIRVIGLVLSYTWLSNHFKGVRIFGLWLAGAMALYLVFGILRASFEPLWTPSLTPIYQWQFVLGGMLLLLVGIALRDFDADHYSPDTTNFEFEPNRPVAPKDTGPIQSTPTVHSANIIAGLVAIVIIFGLASAIFSERHEATLAEKLCAQAQARISDGVEDAVRDGAGLLDRVLGTQTAARIPCQDD